MSGRRAPDTFDVVIVGLGPVGATLAHLLGQHDIRTLVLEREAAAYHLPRAVHFDDEIMRVFQGIGVVDRLLPMLRINPGMRFVDPAGKVLLDWPRPQQESALGWHPSWRFHQPDLENVLRDALTDRASVTVQSRCDVVSAKDSGAHVGVQYDDLASGQRRDVRARYVVGCDGARSLIRQLIGPDMQDFGFHERWLVTDVILKRDRPDLGDVSIQHCNPVRPATYVRGTANRRRWEITVLPDENSETIAAPASVWSLLAGWISPDDADLERSAVYTFRSLIARNWRRGRLLLAGDAAHQMPPFMGQGMCAGIRDVANLGWKLAAVVQGRAADAMLDSYKTERAPNTAEFIETAVRLGRLINAADSETALRKAVPEPDGSARMTSIYPPLGPGLGQDAHAGRQFGQPRLPDGRRMDDLVGPNPIVIADAGFAAGIDLPSGVAMLTTGQAPGAAAHLAAFDARCVVLRPDRYILGCPRTAKELAAILSKLPVARTGL